MNTAIIGLGSNIEPEKNIKQALSLLDSKFKVLRKSSFIKTKPIGYTQQDDFLNGSVLVETDLESEKLSQALKSMENALGRKRSDIKFGPRTIDLDVVVFNDNIIDEDFYKRDYLKNSVIELLPELKY